jgi:hypothetical protein
MIQPQGLVDLAQKPVEGRCLVAQTKMEEEDML